MNKTSASQLTITKLTARQRRAILLLALGASAADVAQEVGVAQGTVYNWKSQNEGFQDELKVTQLRVFEEGVRQLNSLVAEAAASLRSILVSPSSADRDKIFAARTILQFTDLNSSVETPARDSHGGTDEFLKRLGLE